MCSKTLLWPQLYVCEQRTLESPYWGRGKKGWRSCPRCCEIHPQVEKLSFQGSEVADTDVVTHTCQKVIYNWGGPRQTTYLCPPVMP